MAIIEVEKLWGSETWLHNEEDYCAKLLWLYKGFQCSLHYHPVKRETFICVSGKVKLEVLPFYKKSSDSFDVKRIIYLQPYQHFTLEPGIPHRFTAITPDAVIVEASTKHDDNDVVRLEDSCEIR
jgi:D-lyxose ketol-isomerase